MESCELCKGLKGHSTLKKVLFEELDLEYRRAKDEFKLLQELFRDCCWYSFETVCRDWEEPWHTSWGHSFIALNGVRVETNGSRISVTYPTWYKGVVRDAPSLSPRIIYKELKDAKAYMLSMEEQRWAPYDYAPGGHKYEDLLRYGEGVAALTEMQCV